MLPINMHCGTINIFYRDAAESFSKGVLTQQTFEYGKRRALVSLKICFSSWLYELIGSIMTAVSPVLMSLGMQHQYYIDAIIMFLGVPILHLINDEDTKGVIVERNWYRGFRHMAGLGNQIAPQNAPGNQNI